MTAYEPRAGDRALVTGAGSGIGKFLCDSFASRGMEVLAVDIDEEAADCTAREITDGGGSARAFRCDVSDREAVDALAERVVGTGGPPHLLWLNAGVGSADTISGASARTIEWVFGVNVLGPVWCARAFLPAMKEAGGPRHVGITASSASVVPVSGPFPLYATSKQGTAAIGEGLAAELDGTGIGVTLLCPGILDTAIWNAERVRPERFGGAKPAPDEAGAHWRAQPGAPVLKRALDETLARGGGWCIVPTEPDTEAAMLGRHEAQRHGLFRYAAERD